MPTPGRVVTYVHPLAGFRINLHEMAPTSEDKGVPDACRACGRSAKELGAQNPLITLMCCTRCKTNGNVRVLYCSKACQTVDYNLGKSPNQPPHKRSCGKTHVEPVDESLLAVSGALDHEKINLYTNSPTTALQGQVEFLTDNPSAHYGYRRLKNGKSVAHQFQGKGGELFLQMRTEAMERREPASIALMKLLAMSTLPTNGDLYALGDYVPQLEQEYEVDLEDCHRALEGSTRHRDLFDAWVKWATPYIRDDQPTLGVRFGLPWYYLPAGKFRHPVKYRSASGGLRR